MLYIRKVYQNTPPCSRLSQRSRLPPRSRRTSRHRSKTDQRFPEGKKGWSAKGDLDLDLILRLAKEKP
jgi:hypothetical protein